MNLEQAIIAMLDGHKVRHYYYSENEYSYIVGVTVFHEDGVIQSIEEFRARYKEPEFNKNWSILKTAE